MSDMIADQTAAAVDFLRPLLSGFASVFGQQQDANTALTNAKTATGSKAIDAYKAAANAAFVGKWSDDAIDKAIAAVLAGHNDKAQASTLKRFSSELALAMNPVVRGAVPSLFQCADEAWSDERAAVDAAKKAERKLPAQPLMKLWARRSLMMVDLMRKRKGGQQFSSKADIVFHAEANDPSLDAEKVALRLASVLKTMQAFHKDFPDENLGKVVKALGFIDEKSLVKAHEKKVAEAQGGAVEAPPVQNLRDENGNVKVAATGETNEAATDIPLSEAVAKFNEQVA